MNPLVLFFLGGKCRLSLIFLSRAWSCETLSLPTTRTESRPTTSTHSSIAVSNRGYQKVFVLQREANVKKRKRKKKRLHDQELRLQQDHSSSKRNLTIERNQSTRETGRDVQIRGKGNLTRPQQATSLSPDQTSGRLPGGEEDLGKMEDRNIIMNCASHKAAELPPPLKI